MRWLGGEYEGLEEWVLKVRLAASWDEKEALLEDERWMLTVLEASDDVYGTATYRAVETVYSAVPQEAGAEVWFGGEGERENIAFYRRPQHGGREARLGCRRAAFRATLVRGPLRRG